MRPQFAITMWTALIAGSLWADEPPFYLGGRTSDDLPQLTDEELGTAQQQALLAALGGDAYGSRGADAEGRRPAGWPPRWQRSSR